MTPPRWLHWPAPNGGSALWTPSDLATAPEQWFDAAAITGVSDGDQLDTWENLGTESDAERDDTNSVSGYPKYIATSLNGLAGVEWNSRSSGRGTRMDSGTLANRTTDLTIVAVWKPSTVAAGACQIGSASGYYEVAVNRTAAQASVGFWNGSFSATYASSPTINTTSTYITSGVWDRTAETRTIWVNGNQEAQSTGLGSHTYSVGQITYLGNNAYTSASSGQQFEGVLYEWILCTSSYDEDEREKIEGYLAHKWGLESALPSGHPYKAAAP